MDNIGNPASCEDRPSRERPQDVVSSGRDQNGELNCARMRYVALISTFSPPDLCWRSPFNTKLTGFYGAQRSKNPVQRLVMPATLI